MPYTAVMYAWPECQKCEGCVHGETYVQLDQDNTVVQCLEECMDNDGVDCPMFEE